MKMNILVYKYIVTFYKSQVSPTCDNHIRMMIDMQERDLGLLFP